MEIRALKFRLMPRLDNVLDDDKTSDAMKEFLKALIKELQQLSDDVHIDIIKGHSAHGVLDAHPDLASLQEGQFVNADVGAGDRRLYTRLNGVLRYVSWT